MMHLCLACYRGLVRRGHGGVVRWLEGCRSVAQLPDRVLVRCSLGDEPFEGAWLRLTLGVTRKNPFHLVIGPSDAQGWIIVTRDDLLSEARKYTELSPMDYGHPQGDWDGRLIVKLLGVRDIDAALEGHRLWGNAVDRPEGYVDSLLSLRRRLGQHSGALLAADVHLEPPLSAEVTVQENLAIE
jgi:hypothetical protein